MEGLRRGMGVGRRGVPLCLEDSFLESAGAMGVEKKRVVKKLIKRCKIDTICI